MSEWIRTLQKRTRSGEYKLNFLWRSGPVFVMDNHLAAAWCWEQTLDVCESYDFLHIDRHPDCLTSRLDDWDRLAPPELNCLSLDEYCGSQMNYDGMDLPLFRWDNYLPIFVRRHPQCFIDCIFATQHDGDPPQWEHVDYGPWELLEHLKGWLDSRARQVVINLDMDYFFCDDDTDTVLMLDDQYRGRLFEHLASAIREKRVATCTVALSPECCGGWPAAESICAEFMTALGLPFNLPS